MSNETPMPLRVAECFLCNPAEDLVYYGNDEGFALCGLGPLVPGYSVVATRKHLPSVADAVKEEHAGFVDFMADVRDKLISRFGSCLMTEHGRLPVCEDVSGSTDAHCYHAHVLLFPNTSVPVSIVRGYFARTERVSNLPEAAVIARAHAEYFLFSPTPSHFEVLSRPGKLIRQFARFLVADSLGQSSLANWRTNPFREHAVASAMELRALFRA